MGKTFGPTMEILVCPSLSHTHRHRHTLVSVSSLLMLSGCYSSSVWCALFNSVCSNPFFFFLNKIIIPDLTPVHHFLFSSAFSSSTHTARLPLGFSTCWVLSEKRVRFGRINTVPPKGQRVLRTVSSTQRPSCVPKIVTRRRSSIPKQIIRYKKADTIFNAFLGLVCRVKECHHPKLLPGD